MKPIHTQKTFSHHKKAIMANACISLIWSSFFKHLFNLCTMITSSLSSFSWVHFFFTYLYFLCLPSKAIHFSRLMGRYAETMGAVAEPDPDDERQSLHFYEQPKKFTSCPTIFLQAIVPSTGFSVTFRGLLDTGATCSAITRDLATVLLKEGNASCEYTCPQYFFARFQKRPWSLEYRKICGLKLQSVENEEAPEWTLPSIYVDECTRNYLVCNLPVDLLVSKMASLGLPLVSQRGLEKTMWSKEELNSQYRVDMLIGQDLLNAHFNVHPRQPTYHISSSLMLFRTKMGLAFMGQFDTEKFKQWMMSEKEAEVMKRALYFENKDTTFRRLSPTQEDELCCILTPSSPPMSWKECAWCFVEILFSLVIFGIFFSFSLLICLSATVLKLLLFIASLCFTVPSAVQSLYTDHLLLPLLEFTIVIMYFQIAFSKFLNSFFSVKHIDLVSHYVRPVLPLTVRAPISSSSTPITKTVNALIDTGASHSRISAALVRELSLAENPCQVIHFADSVQVELVDIEVGEYQPEQKQNHNAVSAQFTPVCIERTSIDFKSKSSDRLSCEQLTKIGRLVDIPVATVASKEEAAGNLWPDYYQMLIGADLIPSLLMTTSASPRVIPITSNLNAVETRLGYYLQGTQYEKT